MGKSAVHSFFTLCYRAVLSVLVLITIAASLAGRVPPSESEIFPLLGMTVPVLMLLNIVLAIIFLLARKWWGWVHVVALVFNFNYLSAVIQFNIGTDKPANTLKIATYNIQNFGNETTGYSCKKYASMMKANNVDILCFQEFGYDRRFPLDSIKRAFAAWKYSYVPTKAERRSRLSTAIFSRYPLKNKRFINFGQHSSNGAISCDVMIDGNTTIRLFSSHLQTTSISQKRRRWKREFSTDDTRRQVEVAQEAAGTLYSNFVKRAEQAHIIGKHIEESPHPVILCGDLNSTPSSYTYRYLTSLLTDGFRTAGNGYMYTYRYAKRMLRIDYILHSPELRGIDYYSITEKLCSDHNPVVMEIAY